jgi:NADH dehydrogenase FAD-containing subunit
MRIVVLSGGFGGVATVRHLERVLRRRTRHQRVLHDRLPRALG